MGNYISEQLAMFLRSILLGASLGLVYDLLGAVRSLGGRVLGAVLDGLYCLLAAGSLFLFVLAGDGELRIFVLAGALGGAVLFFCLLSGALRPVWSFWLKILLAPADLAWRLGKKCGGWSKKSFLFCRKWFTIKFTALRGRLRPARREGDEAHGQEPGEEKGE